jgi:hypothetical protein
MKFTFRHGLGKKPKARKAVNIIFNGLVKTSIPFFKRAGKIPSSPAVLKGLKPPKSPCYFIFSDSSKRLLPVVIRWKTSWVREPSLKFVHNLESVFKVNDPPLPGQFGEFSRRKSKVTKLLLSFERIFCSLAVGFTPSTSLVNILKEDLSALRRSLLYSRTEAL